MIRKKVCFDMTDFAVADAQTESLQGNLDVSRSRNDTTELAMEQTGSEN